MKTITACLVLTFALTGAARAADESAGFTVNFVNNTHDKFRDDQIFFAIVGLDAQRRMCHLDSNGKLVPMAEADNTSDDKLTKNGVGYANYFLQLSRIKSITLPQMSAGRIFMSMGSPMYIRAGANGYAGADINNPTDPNRDVYFDFVEFTYDQLGFHGNTTQVDQFGFPYTLTLADAHSGTKKAGITEARSKLFEAFKKDAPPEFAACAASDLRIVAPGGAGFREGGPQAHYFDDYINRTWDAFAHNGKLAGGWTAKIENGALTLSGPGAVTITCPRKPTSEEAVLGSGILGSLPQVCAAINRHVLAEPANWNNPAVYYKDQPNNFYAHFWHEHNIGHKAYGFCYDDVNDQSSFVEAKEPKSLQITLGWD